MSDDDADEGDEPAVELGEGTPVEGAPLARLAARYTWPMEKSAIRERDGTTEVRTADGPMALGEALDGVEDTYFGTRRQFLDAVREQMPAGPVPTE